MSDAMMDEGLFALEVAVIERLADERFEIRGKSPAWLEAAFDAAPAGARHTLGGALPFLDDFLRQADVAWHNRGTARATSGPFAIDVGQNTWLLRASAMTVADRSILVLERLTGDADSRPILQKAREQMLATESLTRQASGVHTRVAAIAKAAGELGKSELAPAHRALVDKLLAATTEMQTFAETLPKPATRRK